MLSFDKIVHKMGKKGGKILFKKDIFEIIDPECKPEYDSQVHKVIYQLRAQGIIVSIKAGVYIVPDVEDTQMNEVDLLEKYYVKLLKKYITYHVGSEYFISGSKSLEFHLKDYSISEKIYIVTRNINKKILVGGYEIIFKTISGKYQGKKINLFSKLCGFSKNMSIDGVSLKVSGLELALVESALVTDIEQGLQFDILNKALKKYGRVFDKSVFYEIGKYKYAMSFNRLKEISRPINTELYEVFLDIIKKNGNLFIGEGLRGF